MLIDQITFHRLKRSGANVQSNESMRQFGQHLWGKMQASRRCGDGTWNLREHRLVTIGIIEIALPFDVGRQRQYSPLEKVLAPIERNDALAALANLFNMRSGGIDCSG